MSAPSQSEKPLLTVAELSIGFRRFAKQREIVDTVVKKVEFELHAGETVALVGESGAGKSLTVLSIMQLLPFPQTAIEGSICYHDTEHDRSTELVGAEQSTLQRIRGNHISMIFQEPMTALNPLHGIEKQLSESLALHQSMSGAAARSKILDLLDQVGIDAPETRLNAYPHQLSGGQRQRIMIAMALANQPQILLADEPTTALDVTVQARILQLLKNLQRSRNLGVVLVTHDLNMVRKVAERVLVMKDGKVVERGAIPQVFITPSHSYTKKLLFAEPPRQSPESKTNTGEPLLQVENLKVWLPLRKGLLKRVVGHVKAVNDASFKLYREQNLGIVGESGSGKTTLALAVLRLVKSSGQIKFSENFSHASGNGKPLDTKSSEAMKQIRRNIQIVFQDPYGSLSPRMSVGEIISEGLDAHALTTDPHERDQKVVDILREVEIDPDARFRYPHEFSGGQRQRIAIARALILQPKILFLDEPTSSLDRTVQVQIVHLLKRIQKQHGLAYVFISHDLNIVRSLADELIVMRAGDVVEQGNAKTIFTAPKNSYTQELLHAAELDLV